jgi:hypothetical protein
MRRHTIQEFQRNIVEPIFIFIQIYSILVHYKQNNYRIKYL